MIAAPNTRSADSRWFRDHYDDAANEILTFLGDEEVSIEGRRVADVGCGDGIIDLGLAQRGQPARLVGYDVRLTDTAKLLKRARDERVADELPACLEFASCTPRRLPAADASFDVAVTWSAFEHVSDPTTVLREIRRILVPAGTLMLQLWPFFHSAFGSHLWDWLPPFSHLMHSHDELEAAVRRNAGSEPHVAEYMLSEYRHLNRITLLDLEAAIREAGFRIIKVELLSAPTRIPRALADHPAWLLAVGGVKLLAVPAATDGTASCRTLPASGNGA